MPSSSKRRFVFEVVVVLLLAAGTMGSGPRQERPVAQATAITPTTKPPIDWIAALINLGSTLIGAAMGVIGGLMIAKRSERVAEHKEIDAKFLYLSQAVANLQLTLVENDMALKTLIPAWNSQQANPYIPLDSSAWDAFQGVVVDSPISPAVKGRLAWYFSKQRDLIELNQMLVDYLLGPNANLPQVSSVRQHLANQLSELGYMHSIDNWQLRALLLESMKFLSQAKDSRK